MNWTHTFNKTTKIKQRLPIIPVIDLYSMYVTGFLYTKDGTTV